MPKSPLGIVALHPWEIPWYEDALHPKSVQLKARLQTKLNALLAEMPISHITLLMDAGPILDAAQHLLAQKQTTPFTLECLIPFEAQHANWPEAQREQYFSILQRCDKESLLQAHFSVNCYQRGLQKLLTACQTLLVIWNGAHGDAEDAIRAAEKAGVYLIVLHIENP